jgi:hypothetical protein
MTDAEHRQVLDHIHNGRPVEIRPLDGVTVGKGPGLVADGMEEQIADTFTLDVLDRQRQPGGWDEPDRVMEIEVTREEARELIKAGAVWKGDGDGP